MKRRALIKYFSSAALAPILLGTGLSGRARANQPFPVPLPVPPPRLKAARCIVIDPGHGGIDPGAIGRSGVEEKHIVLAIGLAFAEELERLTGAKVHLTRENDRFLPLEERVQIAQGLKADLFVSVHADSAPERVARGLSIYTLSEHASDRLAAALATSENRVDSLYGVNLAGMSKSVASILVDLARRETLNRSITLQRDLIAGLEGRTRLLERPARAANFAVLRSPEVPAMLIENGFLSNPQDEALLSTAKYRQRLATLLAHTLANSFSAWAEAT
ncbi:MAG TPA: N-acetylmuramoyl-L-alanine amidase [Alphaproteobacteria bacterium]|nr:N-acetylmuramoyl-L-alanine amidase [Alphaproteobacteria bacterium]